MKLRTWNWDLQRYEFVEYPDEPIAQFMDFLRSTKSWHEEPELVHRRLRKLELELSAYRAQHPATVVATTTADQNVALPLAVRPPLPENIPPAPDDRKARQLANLAKGREKLRQKREAALKGG